MAVKTKTKYVLLVESPAGDSYLKVESESPFMAFSAGDLLNPSGWTSLGMASPPDDLYEVIKVEHIVDFAGDVLAHRAIVLVKPVPNDYDTRAKKRGSSKM